MQIKTKTTLVVVLKTTDETVRKTFDGHAFYEKTFVDLSDRLGLTRPSKEECQNNLEGLRLRRQRRLTDDQKQRLLDSQDLTGDERLILELARDNKKAIEGEETIKDIVFAFSGLKVGNIEDINEFFEDVNLSNRELGAKCELSFEKLEG